MSRRSGTRAAACPPARDAGDVVVIAVWAVVTALVLVLEPALYRNHLAAIVPPLALLAAILTRSTRVLAVVLILLVPWSVNNLQLDPRAHRTTAATPPRSCTRCERFRPTRR